MLIYKQKDAFLLDATIFRQLQVDFVRISRSKPVMDAPSSAKLYRARMPRRLDDEVARNAHGPITRWPDNRIGHSADALWRYDGYGNRIEEERHDGSRQRLSYDSAHQLTRLSTQPPRPKPEDSPDASTAARRTGMVFALGELENSMIGTTRRATLT